MKKRKPRTTKPRALSFIETVRSWKHPSLEEGTRPGQAIQIVGGQKKKAEV
jgi:hypothetical protein